LRATLLSLLLSLSPAWGAPADYDGAWSLDRAASGDVEDLMVLQGASFLERKAAASVSVVQTITATDAKVTLDIDSSIKDKVEVLEMDNTPRQQTTDKGGSMTVRHYWGDAGEMISVADVPLADGRGTMTTTRTVSADGGTMTQRITLAPVGGAPVAVDRVFRRR